jgi:hypothetical protein
MQGLIWETPQKVQRETAVEMPLELLPETSLATA